MLPRRTGHCHHRGWSLVRTAVAGVSGYLKRWYADHLTEPARCRYQPLDRPAEPEQVFQNHCHNRPCRRMTPEPGWMTGLPGAGAMTASRTADLKYGPPAPYSRQGTTALAPADRQERPFAFAQRPCYSRPVASCLCRFSSHYRHLLLIAFHLLQSPIT